MALEAGRAKELRRRLNLEDESLLDGLPTELSDAYRAAAAELASASDGTNAEQATLDLQAVITAIRETPGHERFGIGARRQEIERAVQEGWPLVYVNPSPTGTLLLRLNRLGDVVQADSRILEFPSSEEIIVRLMFGLGAGEVAATAEKLARGTLAPGASYLGTAGALASGDMTAALEIMLPWLGQHVAQAIWQFVGEVEPEGLVLIACGPLASAPLHAAPWSTGDTAEVLIDRCQVSFAPSATAHASSIRRAAERDRQARRLVALGDPDKGSDDELPAARAEIAEIARYFDVAHSDLALGPAANSGFLQSRGPGAAHLHLACHGSAGMLDSSEAGVWLADGLLGAETIAALGLQARVTIVSACQGATPEINKLPEEADSTATAFLSAGSASVVAALWPVDDVATAMLMVRFHELLRDHPDRPVQALRGAQLWLRDLTEADEDIFAAAHPEIAGHLRARVAAGRAPGHRSHAGSSAETVRPYQNPYFWAAFIVAGV